MHSCAILLVLLLAVCASADFACLCQANVRVITNPLAADVVDVVVTGACRGDVGICDCFGIAVPCSGDIDGVAQTVVTNTDTTDFLVCDGITTSPSVSTICHVPEGDTDDPACVGTNGTVETVSYEYFQTETAVGDLLYVDTACSVDRTSRSCVGVGPCVTDPVDCVTEKIIFGACNATCGTTGVTAAPVVVVTNSSNGGLACPIGTTLFTACEAQPCPVDCEFSGWAVASPCITAHCGDVGVVVERRTIVQLESFGGDPCVGDLVRELPCVSDDVCTDTTPPTIVDVSYNIDGDSRYIRVVYSENVVVNPLIGYAVNDDTGWQIEDSVPSFLQKPFDTTFKLNTISRPSLEVGVSNVVDFAVPDYTTIVTGSAVGTQYDTNWFVTYGWPWGNTTDAAGHQLAAKYFIRIRDAAAPFVTSAAVNASDATRVIISVSETVAFRDVVVGGVAVPVSVTNATQRRIFIQEDVYVFNFETPLEIDAETTIVGVAVDLAGNETPFEFSLAPTWVNVTMSRSGIAAVYVSGPSVANVTAYARGFRFINSGFNPGEPGGRDEYALLVDSQLELPLLEPSSDAVVFPGSFVGSTLRYRTGWTDGSVFVAILAGAATSIWLPVIDALEPYVLRSTVDVAGTTVRILWSEPMSNASGFVRFANSTVTGLIHGTQFGPNRYVYTINPAFMIAGAVLRFEGVAADNSTLRNVAAAASVNRIAIGANSAAFDDRDIYVRHANVSAMSTDVVVTYRFNRPINVSTACPHFASFSVTAGNGGPPIVPTGCVGYPREPLEAEMGEAESITFSFSPLAPFTENPYTVSWSGFNITSWAGDILTEGGGFPGDGGSAMYNWLIPAAVSATAINGDSKVHIVFSLPVTIVADMALNGAPNMSGMYGVSGDYREWNLTFPFNVEAPNVYTLLVPSDSFRSFWGSVFPPFTATLNVRIVDAEVAAIAEAELITYDTLRVTMNQDVYWADASRALELGRKAFHIWVDVAAVDIYSAEIINGSIIDLHIAGRGGWYYTIMISDEAAAFVTVTGTPVVAAPYGTGVMDSTAPRIVYAMECRPSVLCVMADRPWYLFAYVFPGNEPSGINRVDDFSVVFEFENRTTNGTIDGGFGEGGLIEWTVTSTPSAFTSAEIDWSTGVATVVWPDAVASPGRFRAKFAATEWWAVSSSSSCVGQNCTAVFDLRRGDGGLMVICHVGTGGCGLATVTGRDALLTITRVVYDNYTSEVTVFANRPISTPTAGPGVTIGDHSSWDSHVRFVFSGTGNVTMSSAWESVVLAVPPVNASFPAFPTLQRIDIRRSNDDSAFSTLFDLHFDDCVQLAGNMGGNFRSVNILAGTRGQDVRLVADSYQLSTDTVVAPNWDGFIWVPCTGVTAVSIYEYGVFDAAEPTPFAAYTRDIDRNGVVDAIDVVFSEPVDFPLGVMGADLTVPAYTITEAVALNSTIVRFAVANASSDFPTTFTVNAIPGVCDFAEPLPNCMTTTHFVPLYDGAPAVVETAWISVRSRILEVVFSDDDWTPGLVPTVSFPNMTVGELVRQEGGIRGRAVISRNVTGDDIVGFADATLTYDGETVPLGILTAPGDSPEVMLVTAINSGVAVYFTMPVKGTGASCFAIDGVVLVDADTEFATTNPFRVIYPTDATGTTLSRTGLCDLVGVLNGNAVAFAVNDFVSIDRIRPVPISATLVALESVINIEFSEALSAMDFDTFRRVVSGVSLGELPFISDDRLRVTVPLAAAFTNNTLAPLFQVSTVNNTVFDANGNPSPSHVEPVLITDPAQMTIQNAITRDTDDDGVVDAIFIFTTSAIDKGSVRNNTFTRESFTVTGYSIVGIENTTASNAFVLRVVPTVPSGTAVRPTVRIGAGTGPGTPSSITIRSQNSGDFSRAMADDSFVVRDGAGPVLLAAYGTPGSRVVVVELSEVLSGGLWATFPGIAFGYIDSGAARISSQPAATVLQTDTFARVAFYLTEPAASGNATVRINGPYVTDVAGNRAITRSVPVVLPLDGGGSSSGLSSAELGGIIGGSIAAVLLVGGLSYLLHVRNGFGKRYIPAPASD